MRHVVLRPSLSMRTAKQKPTIRLEQPLAFVPPKLGQRQRTLRPESSRWFGFTLVLSRLQRRKTTTGGHRQIEATKNSKMLRQVLWEFKQARKRKRKWNIVTVESDPRSNLHYVSMTVLSGLLMELRRINTWILIKRIKSEIINESSLSLPSNLKQ